MISLIAAMFTVAWIQRHNELTALMAAGITRVRVVKPVIMACITLAVLTAIGREAIIPRLRKQMGRDARDLMGDQAQQFGPRPTIRRAFCCAATGRFPTKAHRGGQFSATADYGAWAQN